MIRPFSCVAAICILSLVVPVIWAASLADFGAQGDGKTNNTVALKAALASGKKDIYIPPGTYLIGPDPLNVPEEIRLHGAGRSSVFKVTEGTGKLLTLKRNVRLEKLHFDSKGVKKGSESEGLVILPTASDGVTIESVSFTDCDRSCILTDHANDITIRDCEFRKVGLAIILQFSSRAKVLGNTVVDARIHGIQFWGNWKFERKDSSDLIFANNYVKNGGSGAIWGTGATRIVMSGNIVDGAEDVGLDLEWCEDSVITGNTVRNCKNAGISLFFSCQRISITGNTVINDHAIADEDAKKDWWVRSGIWLTYPNRGTFKNDNGHRDVTIVGNTIWSAEGRRRAMWIGRESKNITIDKNTINRGEIKQDSK
ncbi:MAG: right-handed parallel beta-helix repeat-containing protein [Pirellulales bacterium]|nr:right-handed parallel beta-helix repeat-containing protein [Pirellulales bacterium]